MNKNVLQLLKAEERKYIQHYKELYSEYLESIEMKDYRTEETRAIIKSFNRGQVVEAGKVLKIVFNFTDEELEEIERQIERRFLK